MEPSEKYRDNKRTEAQPTELQAPLWSATELEAMGQRVRALMARGHPRSVASQIAFGELTTNRALERAERATREAPEEPAE